jgi:hypothetical protein
MYNPYAYSFHEGLYRTYGTVARVYGFLGVGLILTIASYSLRSLGTGQTACDFRPEGMQQHFYQGSSVREDRGL